MSINAATGHSIGSENPYSNGSFLDDYLAEVKGRNRTSEGDFTTVGNQDLQEIKEILQHLINKLDKISGMR